MYEIKKTKQNALFMESLFKMPHVSAVNLKRGVEKIRKLP